MLSKAYEPQEVEAHWRKHWEEAKTFTPDLSAPGDPYSIVIPPPNVTGILHIGHALNQTLQDILCRHARQKGKNVLWIPGTDHAGIATQNVVERALAKEGKSRHDVGREAFIERVWEWKKQYGGQILEQIKELGSSVDWTREAFTMDDNLARAVRKVFVQLYKEGLIYKGKYIVNWCPRCHTALADDEVDHIDSKGSLWHVRYDFADGSGSVTIATTRPETILGDSAVCVHPDDERYAAFVGKKLIVPVVNREVPLIADRYVDREFGTGCLKVTPCHDPNDWKLGHAHNLEFIQVIDDNGNMCMSDVCGRYAGMSREECRKAIVEELRENGHLVKEEPLTHSVGCCYRCKTVIEPYVSDQWFVAISKMAPAARAAVPDKIKIYPESWTKTYYNWLDNIRDWCISRQIWWGHRIPAWTCADCGELIVAEEDPTVCPKCGGKKLEQDPDVLDTWFSSALWPFSTMGWPEHTETLKKYYPTSVLVTAFDILFFWVARMIMMGQHFMGEVPFREVYIHALVRDAQGRKMSKSLGNGINPQDMIRKYGADSLRFTLAAFAAMGRDIRMSEERIEGYRHFVNKVWNASRFALMNLPEQGEPKAVDLGAIKGLHNKWILNRLEEVKAEEDAALESYRFNDAAQCVYKFLWNEFCDWYLELIKADMKEEGEAKEEAQYVLYTVLREILLLLHPMIPFVTAEVWNALPGHEGTDIATQLYPEFRPQCVKSRESDDMVFLQEAISAIRTIRAELNIKPSYKLSVVLRPASDEQSALLEANRGFFDLARLESLTIDRNAHAPKASASNVVRGCEVIVLLTGAVDFKAELARLDKEIGKVDKDLAALDAKLSNENFVKRAPADLVESEKARHADLIDKKAKMQALQIRFKEAMEE
ncbi:valine--tRNA ligase [uncultured Mailhella sp.]|uniref:valine--tRNA ligase n=1 Tax=uncultured Mailhella sp. TaxID=1981031 RepID=UPI0025D10A76|nr:valine--tRNA ligase [uncultured Mailhella sp.]